MNMQQMMKQAQKMQKQLAQAQEKLGETEVSASAGGSTRRRWTRRTWRCCRTASSRP